jgi:hypothetical protein
MQLIPKILIKKNFSSIIKIKLFLIVYREAMIIND